MAEPSGTAVSRGGVLLQARRPVRRKIANDTRNSELLIK